MPFAGVSGFTDGFAVAGRYLTSAGKLTHQRTSQGVAPVPSVAVLTHAAVIRLATFATVARRD